MSKSNGNRPAPPIPDRNSLSTAKKVAAAQATLDQESAYLSEWEARVVEQSTASQLEAIRQRRQRLQQAEHEVGRARNALLASSKRPPRIEKIQQEVIALQAQRKAIGDKFEESGSIPIKYRRLDACEFFEKQVTEARAIIARIDSMRAKLNPNQSLGARPLQERSEAEAVVREWEHRTLPRCRAGEQIALLDEQLRQLQREREMIEREHREAVLAS